MTDTFTAKGPRRSITSPRSIASAIAAGTARVRNSATNSRCRWARAASQASAAFSAPRDAVNPRSSGTGTELFDTAADVNLSLPRTPPRPRMRRRPGGRSDSCAQACTPYELQFVKTVWRCKTPGPPVIRLPVPRYSLKVVAQFKDRSLRINPEWLITRRECAGIAWHLEHWRSETEKCRPMSLHWS
jgi:hypothetical protein